ncbi:hypothetical protein CKO28_00115 [Rhodovibrio sodomensis]|uniref:Uncharacterized protein n=2 Tax=Rhodovibrio sodomensis TaxID=1088 RepID=A0ABS1D9M3_9PROT|nr:hypothetical protein [Rhodovibrio sodomensis]
MKQIANNLVWQNAKKAPTPQIAAELMELGDQRHPGHAWKEVLPPRLKRAGSWPGGGWPKFWTWNATELDQAQRRFIICGERRREQVEAYNARGGRQLDDSEYQDYFQAAQVLAKLHAAAQTATQNRADLKDEVSDLVAQAEPTVDSFAALIRHSVRVRDTRGVGKHFAGQQVGRLLKMADEQSDVLAERVRDDIDALQSYAALTALRSEGADFEKEYRRARRIFSGWFPSDFARPASLAFSTVEGRSGTRRLALNLVELNAGDLSDATPYQEMQVYSRIYELDLADVSGGDKAVLATYQRELVDRYYAAKDTIADARCGEATAPGQLDELRDATFRFADGVATLERFVCVLAGRGLDVAYNPDALTLTLTPGEYPLNLKQSEMNPFDEIVLGLEMQSTSRGMQLVPETLAVDGDDRDMSDADWARLSRQLEKITFDA